MSFVHLHTHSHYSLLRSSSSVSDLVKRVKSLGMESVALTDRGNMYGAVEFYFAAKKEGLKPIVGVEISIADESIKVKDSPCSLVLLAQSYKGYQNLSSIVSFAHKENQVNGIPKATFDIIQKHSEDLICLTGGPFEGFGPSLLKAEGTEAFDERLLNLKSIFSEKLYLEIFDHDIPQHQTLWVDYAKEASKKLNVPLVLTNDTRFTEREDLVPHNVLIGIGKGKKLEEVESESLVNSQFYIKSPSSMKELSEKDPDFIKAFENSFKIADLCNIEFTLERHCWKTNLSSSSVSYF